MEVGKVPEGTTDVSEEVHPLRYWVESLSCHTLRTLVESFSSFRRNIYSCYRCPDLQGTVRVQCTVAKL